MAFVIGPSRPGSVVAEAFRLKAIAERRDARIHKTYRKKPVAEAPPPAKKKAKKK